MHSQTSAWALVSNPDSINTHSTSHKTLVPSPLATCSGAPSCTCQVAAAPALSQVPASICAAPLLPFVFPAGCPSPQRSHLKAAPAPTLRPIPAGAVVPLPHCRRAPGHQPLQCSAALQHTCPQPPQQPRCPHCCQPRQPCRQCRGPGWWRRGRRQGW